MNRKLQIKQALENNTFRELKFENDDDILFELFEQNLELDNFKNCALITTKLSGSMFYNEDEEINHKQEKEI